MGCDVCVLKVASQRILDQLLALSLGKPWLQALLEYLRSSQEVLFAKLLNHLIKANNHSLLLRNSLLVLVYFAPESLIHTL